jgi:phage protein U
MFALLGEIFFAVLTSPEGFRSSSEYRYAQHDVVEAPPRLQWLSNDLQKISLDLGFHLAFTNPSAQMAALRAAAEDHQARALVFGNGVFRGYFVIESIEETHQQLADDGSYIAIAARLELREWVPGADFDPLSPPRRSSPPPGIVQSPGGAQPISATNLLPTSAIVQLTRAGAGPGVTYSPAAYSSPGMSAVVGTGFSLPPPGNPDDVPTSTIVRAG